MPSDPSSEQAEHPLNRIACPDCGEVIDDTVPACPNCGRKMYVEHPADITPLRHNAQSGVGQTNRQDQE